MNLSLEFNSSINVKMATTNDVYRTIFSDDRNRELPEIKKSEHFKAGAVVNELSYLRAYMYYVSHTYNVDGFIGDELEDFLFALTKIVQNKGETVHVVTDRFKSLMYRKKIISLDNQLKKTITYSNIPHGWDNKWGIRSVLEFYERPVYIMEMNVDNTLIVNGDFEIIIGAEWTLANSATRTTVFPRVSGLACLLLPDSGSATQTVSGVSSVPHTLTLFYLGKVIVTVTKPNLDDVIFSLDITSEWTYHHMYIDTNPGGNVVIEIKSEGANSFVDLVEFGVRDLNPHYQALFPSEIGSGLDASLDDDTNSPNEFEDEFKSSLDRGFSLKSSEGVFPIEDKILDIISPAGVRREIRRAL